MSCRLGRSLVLLWLTVLCMAAGPLPQDAEPAASDWVESTHSRVRLIAARSALDGEDNLLLGMQIQLDPGWKTYWRAVGEAGLPPHFDWSGSDNLDEVEVRWPAPVPVDSAGSWGYADEIVLPLRVQPEDAYAPLHLRLRFDYAVCREICVPLTARLALDLPAGHGEPTPFAPLIERYVARLPAQDEDKAGLWIEGAQLIGEAPQRVLEVQVRSLTPLEDPLLLVEAPAGILLRLRAADLSPDRHHAFFTLAVDEREATAPIEGQRLVFTLLAAGRALEGSWVFESGEDGHARGRWQNGS